MNCTNSRFLLSFEKKKFPYFVEHNGSLQNARYLVARFGANIKDRKPVNPPVVTSCGNFTYVTPK